VEKIVDSDAREIYISIATVPKWHSAHFMRAQSHMLSMGCNRYWENHRFCCDPAASRANKRLSTDGRLLPGRIALQSSTFLPTNFPD
jgi:hypothetical protein